MNIVERPWGTYEVLYDGPDCKVKRITVNPGQRLSSQSHKHREEHWTIVSGRGFVEVHDVKAGSGFAHDVNPGATIFIPKEARHRIGNWPVGAVTTPGTQPSTVPLVFIEVQLGTYFGEDDIVRYSDDYGRAP